LLKDLNPGSGGSFPRDFVAIGAGTVLFGATSAAAGNELWITDGTAAGTAVLRDIRPGAVSSNAAGLVPFVAAGGQRSALFVASDGVNGTEPWISDGTAQGTRMLRDVYPGSGSSGAWEFTDLGDGRALFVAGDRGAGVERDYELWITDIDPGLGPSNPSGIVAIGGGRALFTAWTEALGAQPYVTDGTAQGTQRLGDFPTLYPGSEPDWLTLIGAPPGP
jgi:ELWxxDGT repeat protein